MRRSLKDINDEIREINDKIEVIQNIEAPSGAYNAEQRTELTQLGDRLQNLLADKSLEEQRQGISPGRGRLSDGVDPAVMGMSSRTGLTPSPGRMSGPPTAGLPRGFQHFGEFFRSVRDSSRVGGTIDPRLAGIYNGPSSTAQEGIGSEGGFAVPSEWSRDIMELVTGEQSMIGLMNVTNVSGNTYIQPTDQRAPWDNTGGVVAYWGAEGKQYVPTDVDLNANTKRLCKLTCLAPVTEELLEDAPSLDAYLRQKVSTIFDFQIKFALIQGSGVAVPLGILNSPALIVVAKQSSQAASTIIFQNVLDMWAHLIPGSETRCFWLATKRAQEQLMKMFIPIPNAAGTDNVSGLQVYIPMGSGISGTPYDRLMGRPVLYTEACNALGTPGDIILVDGQQYGVILKTGGLQTLVSIHLWFDYGITAYRFHIRIDGAPFLSAPVLSRDGTTEYSPFLALAQRS